MGSASKFVDWGSSHKSVTMGTMDKVMQQRFAQTRMTAILHSCGKS
jgi:hypothetical protein